MRYEIPSLETKEALEFARRLSEIDVTESFTFGAKMKWVRPFGMLLTASSIKQFRNKYLAYPFNLEYLLSKESVSYAAHMGFFRAISEKIELGNGPGGAIGNDNYIPITEIDLNQVHRDEILQGRIIPIGDAIEKKSKELARILSRSNDEIHIVLTYLIRETIRNIQEHSGSCKAWVCGQYWSDQTAEIAVLDEGVGVRSSLYKNPVHRQYVNTDCDAIVYAIKAGISRSFHPATRKYAEDPWANSGFGLYMISEICRELNGSFCLASGNSYINILSDGKTESGKTMFAGTAVKIMISTDYLGKGRDVIRKIASHGEVQAKLILNAFKKASVPSKGFIDDM